MLACRASARSLGVAAAPAAAHRLAQLTAAATGFPRRAYHQNIVDHYENPRNVGAW